LQGDKVGQLVILDREVQVDRVVLLVMQVFQEMMANRVIQEP
jgi:hypothetical protein